MERNGVLAIVTARLKLGNITLREISESLKTTYRMIPFIRNAQDGRVIRGDRKQISGFLQLEKLGAEGDS